jgi:hypothetical protein
LRRVIDRYRLDCLFVEDAPGQYHHTTRPGGYDYSVDVVHPKGMETWKDRVWLRRVPCTWPATEALHALRESGALSDWGRLIFLFPGW